MHPHAPMRWLIVMDTNTQRAIGEHVIKLALHHPRIDFVHPHCFEDGVQPTTAHAQTIQQLAQLHHCNAILAVGSGTLNDLCKYAAFHAHLPYGVIATAPSMNGYVSGNASMITPDGVKSTLPAAPPRAVLCPLSVLTHAPMRLIQAGFGDAICRSTAQVDWLLSHLLLDTPYNNAPFALTRGDEPDLLASAHDLAERAPHAIALLMKNLLDSGQGMTLAGGSYPASQGEHMLAHTLEMMHHHAPHLAPLTTTFHGEDIAVTTLYMAQHHAHILASPIAPQLRDTTIPTDALIHWLSADTAHSCIAAYHEKCALIGDLAARQQRLNDTWDTIRPQLLEAHIAPAHLEAALRAIHAPTSFAQLDWQPQTWHHATQLARFTRNRFTALDL
jgi:glycerol-1-phosphate dehydrogenase [NAD(P)+]